MALEQEEEASFTLLRPKGMGLGGCSPKMKYGEKCLESTLYMELSNSNLNASVIKKEILKKLLTKFKKSLKDRDSTKIINRISKMSIYLLKFFKIHLIKFKILSLF